MPEIHVLGIPLSPAAEALLARADVVAAGRRHLELAPPHARRLVIGKDLALDEITSATGTVCVLASGDPGFFGIVRALSTRGVPLDVHPAPSSVALAFARLGLPWDDAIVVSAHGRDPRPAINTALRHPKVAILTEPRAPAEAIVAALPGRTVTVAEALGTPSERLHSDPPFAEPNVVIVHEPPADGSGDGPGTHEPSTARSADRPAPRAAAADGRATVWPPRTPTRWALPDDAFEHRAGMITKAEVRALVLAALGPGVGDLVWDVGCGSGSVAIECSRLGAAVVAVDRDPEAIALTGRNAAAHGVPVRTIAGAAPGVLAELPDPDAVFIGGGGRDLPAIIDASREPRAIVVTLALVDRIAPTIEQLERRGLDVTATTLQANRVVPLAGGRRLAAENPVTVIVGRR